VEPVITGITTNNVCLAIGNTPTVTFTAVDNGNVDSYVWSYTLLSGGTITTTDNFLTLNLDANSIGEVSVTPSNNICVGNTFTLDVPRNALNVSFSRVPAGPFFPDDFAIIATANIPLEMRWTKGKKFKDVDGCRGILFGPSSTGSTLSSVIFYSPKDPSQTWISLLATDPLTGCERCYVMESASLPPAPLMMRSSKNISNFNPNKLKVSSNPVNSKINVLIPNNIVVNQMVLLNSKGEVVVTKDEATLNSAEQIIDVSMYAKGVYFLYSQTNFGVNIEKIVIN